MKLTKRDLKERYSYIVRAGYCELATMERSEGVRELGYACGVYGWNWTAYEIQATSGQYVCLCTGYRDMTGGRVKGLEKFEEKAKKIASKNIDYYKKQKLEKKNAAAFADFVKENYEKGE